MFLWRNTSLVLALTFFIWISGLGGLLLTVCGYGMYAVTVLLKNGISDLYSKDVVSNIERQISSIIELKNY